MVLSFLIGLGVGVALGIAAVFLDDYFDAESL